jgi:hypothetical protein
MRSKVCDDQAKREIKMRRRDGTPLWIGSDGRAFPLNRIDLSGGNADSSYNEAWLQDLLFAHPEIFPTEQIEPGFGHVVPLCRELPLTFGAGRTGALDNVFTTVDGRLLLVEAKLWRNPEARRTVIAQAMEYAAAIFRLDYEQFQLAVMRARKAGTSEAKSLYQIVKKYDEHLDESEFVDAVSRNLKRGRAIIAVVGDGIREDLEPLAELLQTHAGHRFTFALVELAIYKTADGNGRVVTPSVLAKTALIERGVVQIAEGVDGGRQILVGKSQPAAPAASKPRPMSLGEDEFYEILDQRDPGVSGTLKEFLNKADALGITVDRKSGLNLKHAAPEGNQLNLGTIDKSGFVDTSPSTWWNRSRIGRVYNEALAKQIGGFVREMKDGQESAVRTAAGKMPRITDFLPAHEEAWLAAISEYTRAFFTEAED